MNLNGGCAETYARLPIFKPRDAPRATDMAGSTNDLLPRRRESGHWSRPSSDSVPTSSTYLRGCKTRLKCNLVQYQPPVCHGWQSPPEDSSCGLESRVLHVFQGHPRFCPRDIVPTRRSPRDESPARPPSE